MARTIFSWRVPPVVLSTGRHLPHVERTGEATSSMPCRRNDHRATDRLATASRSPGRRSDPESWRKRRPSPSFPSLLNPHSLMSGKWLGGKLTDIKDILKAQVALSRSFQRFTIQSRSGRKTSPGCEAASVRNPDNDVSENQPSRDEPAHEGFLHRLRDWPQCRRDRRRAPIAAARTGPGPPRRRPLKSVAGRILPAPRCGWMDVLLVASSWAGPGAADHPSARRAATSSVPR